MTVSSTSYWQHTAPDFPLSTDLPPSVDVAVIGGGLLGAATCYWLARAGVRVALLERTAPGLPGAFFVGGFSGHGMPFGIRFGQLLAETVIRGILSPELLPFRLDRPSLRRWDAIDPLKLLQ